MKLQSIAIFCGSKEGKHSMYAAHAKKLGAVLAERQIALIYGGGNKGLMGIAADSVMDSGGIVRGVIPQVLIEWEHQHENITELLVVEDMHIRKRKMYELADAAIILPGGFGTLDELFEMLTWNQLAIHDKKIFLLNTAGFYTHLIAHMRLLSSEDFLYGNLEDQITVINDPEELIQHLS